MMGNTFNIITLGCKTNFAESSSIAAELMDRGLVLNDEHPDILILNTCAVTERAERDARKIIRSFRRKNPQGKIIVTGCFAQYKQDRIKEIDGEAIVVGNNLKHRIPDIVYGKLTNIPYASYRELNGIEISYGNVGRTRSFLKIQDGCDYFCSYCIIPFLRGPSRSVPIPEIINAIKKAMEKGINEVVLTGINIGCWGEDIGMNFLHLLKAIKETGIPRVRISSLEPDKVTPDLIYFIKDNEWIMPHFHLPLQSGSDRILRAMRRHYTKSHYASLVEKIITEIPHCCIGVDVITGFPGETDDDFNETYNLLSYLPVGYLHVFTFSSRPGTTAHKMKNHVSPKEKARRTRMLRHLSHQKKVEFMKRFMGLSRPTLIEREIGENTYEGLTDNYIRVYVKDTQNMICRGSIYNVRIVSINEDEGVATGEIISV